MKTKTIYKIEYVRIEGCSVVDFGSTTRVYSTLLDAVNESDNIVRFMTKAELSAKKVSLPRVLEITIDEESGKELDYNVVYFFNYAVWEHPRRNVYTLLYQDATYGEAKRHYNTHTIFGVDESMREEDKRYCEYTIELCSFRVKSVAAKYVDSWKILESDYVVVEENV